MSAAIHSSAGAPNTALLAELLEKHPEGIVYFDAGFRILFANAIARRISRILPEHINSFDHWHLYPETVGTPLEDIYRRVLATRQPETVPDFLYGPFGTWYRVRAIPVADGFAIYYNDVTHEHQLEEKNRATEDRLSFALEAANGVGVWDWDIVNDRVHSDARFAHLYGVTAEEASAGVTIARFTRNIHPDDLVKVGPLIQKSLATGGDFASEYRLLQPDGSVRWVSARGRTFLDDAGKPLHFPGVTVDITEQKEQAEAIDRQRRELEAIYDGSPIGMALYEPKELRLTRINNRQAEVFRLTPEEAIGRRYEDITAGVPEVLRLIRRAAAGETVLNNDVEGAIDRLPSEYRFWNVNYSPIFAEDGTVQAIAAATIETTVQKQAERALIQAEKLAAVGRLASSIAHEINNPLEAVTNLLYLANSHANDPDVATFLHLAEQELRRVSVIANQTLRFHKQSTRPTEISADELFDNVLGLYEGRLKNSSITVHRRSRAIRAVACFEGDVRQVLNNLVGNAIDAMSTGGRLLLRCHNATDWPTGRQGLTLTIADSGTGILEDAQRHIFEAFYTTKGYNGTGLGLWISKDIIDRHQGRLRVRSSTSPGRHGTVFTLFLPFKGPLTLATPVPNESHPETVHS